MSKFFVNREDIQGDQVLITGENRNHIKNVLRLQPDDEIVINDGEGTDYRVRLEQFRESDIIAAVVSHASSSTEPPVHVVLFQGLPKSDKMDLIIQKCVELGIGEIVPVLTERTVVRLDNPKDTEKKLSRWNRIAEEASKQCNRGRVPQVSPPLEYKKMLKKADSFALRIVPYENEKEGSLKNILGEYHSGSIALLIGPEGGFSEREIQMAKTGGFVPVTLGPRILRTETAGFAVLSAIMYELGDMSI